MVSPYNFRQEAAPYGYSVIRAELMAAETLDASSIIDPRAFLFYCDALSRAALLAYPALLAYFIINPGKKLDSFCEQFEDRSGELPHDRHLRQLEIMELRIFQSFTQDLYLGEVGLAQLPPVRLCRHLYPERFETDQVGESRVAGDAIVARYYQAGVSQLACGRAVAFHRRYPVHHDKPRYRRLKYIDHEFSEFIVPRRFKVAVGLEMTDRKPVLVLYRAGKRHQVVRLHLRDRDYAVNFPHTGRDRHALNILRLVEIDKPDAFFFTYPLYSRLPVSRARGLKAEAAGRIPDDDFSPCLPD